MAIIYVLANQKGGAGKSTTAAAIASGSVHRGKTVLAVDADPQANLTFFMDGDQNKSGTFELITGTKEPVIQHTKQGDLLSGSMALASADTILEGSQRVYALRDKLKGFRRKYDVIVIDTAPTLGTLLINALAAGDSVIIPIRAKMIHLQGLHLLSQTIDATKKNYNHGLKVAGILFTEYNGRTIAARDVADEIRDEAKELKYHVFNTVIRQGVAIDECQILRQSIFDYASKSNQAIDYNNFLNELGI